MDRRKRYSIGTSINLSSPVADSTRFGEEKNPSTQRPKRKPTSPLHNSAKSIFKASSSSGFSSIIDPIVYTDAKSSGLASRIVKYHENAHGSQSQSSSNPKNLYDRPGQLPLVHLKKVEIKYVPKRSLSASSVRIAPPKKSMFQTSYSKLGPLVSMASVILSSTSTLKKPAAASADGEKQLTENEPLAPSSETTSKSALDALKEISRKRINSEELDVDRYKKQCKELTEVDGMVEVLATTAAKNAVAKPLTSKRTRETTSSVQNNSAEQLQKKLCTKNNDILSSLSSSLSAPSLKCAIDTKKLQSEQVIDDVQTAPRKSVSANWQPPLNLNQETAKAVTKTISEPVMATHPASPAGKAQKLTLFNKKYDKSSVVRQVISSDDDEEEERDNFIVPLPKNRSPIMVTGKESLRQVEKSKLSLMLSCLNDEDEVDKPRVVKTVVEIPKEIVAPLKETVTKVLEVNTPKQSLEVSKETEKVPQPLSTELKLPDTLKPIIKETATTVAKDSAQLSTANLISFSPAPVAKPKEVSFAPVPTTVAISFSAPQTITLPAPKTLLSMASSEMPKTSMGFETLTKPVTSSETSKTPSFESAIGKKNEGNNSVTATIKIPVKTFSFGEPTGAATTTATPTLMFSSTTQAKSLFENVETKNTSFVSAPPPAYSMSSSAKVADNVTMSTNSSLSGIVFGNTVKPPATAASMSGGFSFGQSTATAPAFGLGAPKPVEPLVNKEEKPAMFAFGAKPSSAPAFSFGSSSTAQADKTNIGLSAPTQTFGAAVPKTTETSAKPTSFSFGGEKPSLGSGFNFNSFPQQATPPTPFGKAQSTANHSLTTPQPTNSSSNFFGSQPAQSASIFGQKLGDAVDKPAEINIFGANSSSPNVFGAGGLSSTGINTNLFTAKSEGSNIFGSVSSKPPTYTPPSTQAANTFGATAVQNPAPAFSFGGTSASQPDQSKTTAGFSFGNQSNAPAPISSSFSFAGNSGNQTPAVFGGGSALTPTGTGSGFNFSSGSNNQNNSSNNNTPNSSPFAFKSTSDSTPNFSSGTSAKPAAFNFGGPNVAQPGPNMFGDTSGNPMAPMNPFNMVSGGSQQQQQQRRPMRQGMRRLNK